MFQLNDTVALMLGLRDPGGFSRQGGGADPRYGFLVDIQAREHPDAFLWSPRESFKGGGRSLHKGHLGTP